MSTPTTPPAPMSLVDTQEAVTIESGMSHPSRLSIVLLVSAALAVGLPTKARAEETRWQGDVLLFRGQKILNKTGWSPSEDQDELGLESSWGKMGWPVRIAIDFFRSSDYAVVPVPVVPISIDSKLSMSTMELGLGFRKVWRAKHASPYLGAGVVVVQAHQEKVKENAQAFVTTQETITNIGPGSWVGGGIFWTLGGHVDLGLDARYSYAPQELLADPPGPYSIPTFETGLFNTGGFHYGVTLGWGWGPDDDRHTPTDVSETPARAGPRAGMAQFLVGKKDMKNSDWTPSEVQPDFGVEFTFGKATWPVLVAVDYLGSHDVVTVSTQYSAHNETARTAEYAGGVRKIWEREHFRMFGGVGVMYVVAGRDYNPENPYRECTICVGHGEGGWGNAGVAWKFGPFVHVGMEARYSVATVQLDQEIDAGGFHYGLVIGGAWAGKAAAPVQ